MILKNHFETAPRFFCAVIMAGCAVFGALFDIYKFHHRHDDEKKK